MSDQSGRAEKGPSAGGGADLSPVRRRLGWPTVPLQGQERLRLERLLTRTLGEGFKLAMLEVRSPSERKAVLNWLQPTFLRLNARVDEVNLAELSKTAAAKGGSRFNLWNQLTEIVPPSDLDVRNVLVLSGFEDVMYLGRADRSELLQQINVQRDLFVRDYPCWWLLFIHPRSRQRWHTVAPDVCDFVACWIEAPLEESGAVPNLAGIHQRLAGRSRPTLDEDWPTVYQRALELATLGRYDEAEDLVQARRSHAESEQDRTLAARGENQ